MTVRFDKVTLAATFENPFNNFEPVTMTGELRKDPVTGHVARIVPHRLRPFEAKDLSALIEASQKICPFCPEKLPRKASRFTPEFGVETGRIRCGEAVLVPNAFPYARYSAVTVLGPRHFVAPGSFTPEMFVDGFGASQEYFRHVLRQAPEAVYGYVNANYMPLSGAGLVHPHLQVVAAEEPTTYHGKLLDATTAYDRDNPRSLFQDLIRTEKEAGERYIGRIGPVHWLSSFAPVGMFDIWGVAVEAPCFLDMDPSFFRSVGEGLCRVIRYFGGKNIWSFNLSLYTFTKAPADPPFLLVRLVPRVNLPGFDVSEINYFERLHEESVTFFVPEETAGELREFFQEFDP